MQKALYVSKGSENLPVAFASNALYVLERNGGGNRDDYEKVLLPILRKKIDYLHGEGVAQAVWALSNAGIWDSEIWDGLKGHIANKTYDQVYVKNQRWSSGYYTTHTGTEHFFQRELNDLT